MQNFRALCYVLKIKCFQCTKNWTCNACGLIHILDILILFYINIKNLLHASPTTQWTTACFKIMVCNKLSSAHDWNYIKMYNLICEKFSPTRNIFVNHMSINCHKFYSMSCFKWSSSCDSKLRKRYSLYIKINKRIIFMIFQ